MHSWQHSRAISRDAVSLCAATDPSICQEHEAAKAEFAHKGVREYRGADTGDPGRYNRAHRNWTCDLQIQTGKRDPDLLAAEIDKNTGMEEIHAGIGLG